MLVSPDKVDQLVKFVRESLLAPLRAQPGFCCALMSANRESGRTLALEAVTTFVVVKGSLDIALTWHVFQRADHNRSRRRSGGGLTNTLFRAEVRPRLRDDC